MSGENVAGQALNATVIQGNTDAFFRYETGEAPPGKREDRFVAHLEWMQAKLGPERTGYLAGLPFSHAIVPAPGQGLLVVHANPRDQERAILPRMSQAQLDDLLVGTGDWAALAFGHLHVCQGLSIGNLWRRPLVEIVASYEPGAEAAIADQRIYQVSGDSVVVLVSAPQ